MAALSGVNRSTISGAVRQIRPLLAARGFAVPDHPGIRLRTLKDVFAYAAAEGVKLRIDGTDVQVRRPASGRPGRKAFISGKRRQNTIKTTTFSDGQGHTLFSGAARTHAPTPNTSRGSPLQRYGGRREDFAETQAAIAGGVCDRSARRATRSITGTDVVLARTAAC